MLVATWHSGMRDEESEKNERIYTERKREVACVCAGEAHGVYLCKKR